MKTIQFIKAIPFFVLGFYLLLILPNPKATAADQVFPHTGWPISAPEAQGMRSHVLAEMMGHIKTKSLHIHSLAIVRNGQRIFVVPAKNLVVVFTGDLTGGESLMAKKLLDDHIIPAASSSTALPVNEVDHAWLKAHVARLAQQPPEAITWIAEKEGVAKDGVFSRTAPPAFEFKYPFGSKKAGIEYPGQIMRMKTIGGIDFSAFVDDIPEGVELEAFDPTIYARQLTKVGSNIEVVSHDEITLACGTRAYRTEIKWLWKDFMPIMTMLISTYKDDQLVFVSAHPSWNHYMADPIIENLRFHEKCAT